MMPNQPLDSKSGRPCSANVGTSFSRGNRAVDDIAIALILPPSIAATADGGSTMPSATWPPIRSVTTGAMPAIRHHRQLDAGHLVEHLGGEMHQRAVAAVPDGKLLALRERDDLAQRLGGKRRRGGEDEGRARQHRDRRQILARVVGHLLAERDVAAKRAGAAEADGVAVGRRARDRRPWRSCRRRRGGSRARSAGPAASPVPAARSARSRPKCRPAES